MYFHLASSFHIKCFGAFLQCFFMSTLDLILSLSLGLGNHLKSSTRAIWNIVHLRRIYT